MRLLNGRPTDLTGRLDKEIRVYDLLDGLGIEYQRIDHEATMTMEACAAVDRVLDATICKTDFYLLMIPGDKQFKTSVLSKQIGSSRLSFADREHMEALLDITPGSLSVLGLMNDREHRVQLLIDEEILAGGSFGCHPCVNTSSLRLEIRDLLEVFLPATNHRPRLVQLPREG